MLFSTLAFLLAAAQPSLGVLGRIECDLSKETMMKYGMECLAHDRGLMFQIIEHMDNPEAMAKVEFVCSYQKDLVDLAVCMEKKLSSCLPEEVAVHLPLIFNKERLGEALAFFCLHKKELGSKCMDDGATQELSTCLDEKIRLVASQVSSDRQTEKEARALLCRFDVSFDQCLESHHGVCSKKFVNVFEEILKKMLPHDLCVGVDLQANISPRSKLLGSLLLHGQPLKFEPYDKLGAGYNTVQG